MRVRESQNKVVEIVTGSAWQSTQWNENLDRYEIRPEVIKLFSCSTQLSTKFQLLINTKIPRNKEVSCFESLRF